jgi:hypothetical protein
MTDEEELRAVAARSGMDPEVLRHLRASRLHVCIPMYGGMCCEATFRAMVSLAATVARLGVVFTLETMKNESLIPRARNNMVAGFLSNEGATHLLFVDADLGFEPVDVLKLVCSNVDVVGGVYPMKTLPVRYVFNRIDEPVRLENLVEVRHVGTGFMLVKRDVIEKMVAEHPELKYKDSVGYGARHEPNMYALFDTSIDEDGHYLSEDWTFCARWRALGGKIFARTDVCLDHHGAHCYAGDLARLRLSLENEEA